MSESRTGKKIKGCLYLFILQIVLLAIWGALFFLLGLTAQYGKLPFVVQTAISLVAPNLVTSSPQATAIIPPLPSPVSNVTNEGLVLTIKSVSKIEGLQIDTPGEIWRIDVTIKNPTTDPIETYPWEFSLSDSQGRQFAVDMNVLVKLKFALDDEVSLSGPTVNPDLTADQVLAFQLPPGLDQVVLHYSGASLPVRLDGD